MYKFALGIEYNGARYFGWQRQNEADSIQEKIENALSQIINEYITVYCAARTDAGVHGTGQVIHFTTNKIYKNTAFTLGLNAKLPEDIAVRWMKFVSNDFHARFSAISRCYRYIIYNNQLRPAILNRMVMHFTKPLNAERMHRAAQYLIGENDFTSFRAAHCQSKSPWRKVLYINVNRLNSYIIIEIKANSFVCHMVRNIIGSLIEIGTGRQPEHWIIELLNARDRKLAGATVKPNGLYLISVDYPQHFKLPEKSMSLFF